MTGRIAGLLVLLVIVVAITQLGGGSNTPTAGRSAAAPGVPWGDYAPSLKGSIDALAASVDCDGLQRSFNAADANNVATMSRTGHNNAGLMGYIDASMAAAGCY